MSHIKFNLIIDNEDACFLTFHKCILALGVCLKVTLPLCLILLMDKREFQFPNKIILLQERMSLRICLEHLSGRLKEGQLILTSTDE